MASLAELQKEFFKHEIATKLYHFQTKRYGAHKQSDAYLTKFLLNADQLQEILQGLVGQMRVKRMQLDVRAPTDASYPKELQRFAAFMRALELPAAAATVRDQMVADAEQLLYLLEFK